MLVRSRPKFRQRNLLRVDVREESAALVEPSLAKLAQMHPKGFE